MRIVILSDTHRNLNALQSVIERNIGFADFFIHLGDGENEIETIRDIYPDIKIYNVKGNCDIGPIHLTDVIEAGNHRIFCTHGHIYSVNSTTTYLRSIARDNNCDIALFGHTHVRHIELSDGIYIVNPGSASQPRDGKKPSFATIEITDNDEIVIGHFDV